MRTRILTALVLCLVIAVVLLLLSDPVYYGILLGLILVAAAWEWSGFLKLPVPAARLSYVLLVLAGCAVTRVYFWAPDQFLRVLQGALLWWIFALIWVVRAPAQVGRWLAALAGLFTLVPSIMTLLRVITDWPQGVRAVLLIVGVAVAMDTGGYFAGRAFGRHRLAPRVSPGKTWEGLAGGLLLLFLLALLLTLWLPYARWPFVTLALVSGGFSVVGDLTESLLKRANGLKDSGRLLPGHGGVLDRLDSITAAAPITTLCLIWLGAGA